MNSFHCFATIFQVNINLLANFPNFKNFEPLEILPNFKSFQISEKKVEVLIEKVLL
jgi:hypothetical protein